MSITKKQTETITLRLSDDLISRLTEESKTNGITLNAFVNQVLKKYVEWGAFESKVGLVPLSKKVIAMLFSFLDENEITFLASNVGKQAAKEISLFMKMELNIESFLEWFESRIRKSSIEINKQISNGRTELIIKHDLGYNWSLFQKRLIENVFSEYFKRNVNCNALDTILTIRIEM